MSAAPPYATPRNHAAPYGYQPVPANFNNHQQQAPPPPYSTSNQPPPAVQPSVSQQSSTNVVVVQSQPTPSLLVHTYRPVGDHFLTLSIVLTVLCVLLGTWYGLICTIPAMIFSIMARDADQRGDMATAQTHGRISLGLNITSLIGWVVIGGILMALFIVFVVHSGGSDDCYYNGYYSSYDC